MAAPSVRSAVPAEAGLVPARTPIAENQGARPEGEATARIVGLILEFTRWPGGRTQPDPVRLCVAGPVGRPGGLTGLRLRGGQDVRRIDVAHPAAATAAACDAVYLGRVNPAAAHEMTNRLRREPVVTLAEGGHACAGAMFCLLPDAQGHPFRFDAAAVGDSAVIVDPRLLRMGHGG